MNKPHSWTDEELTKLKNLAENHALSWQQIGKDFGVDGERARAAYRRTVGAKESGYKEKLVSEPEEETVYEQGNDFINIVCASKRVLSKEDIVEQFNIDLNIWEIERFKVKTSEGYRKDRSVIWRVQNGTVLEGDVNDSGKMLIVPLYHVEVRLVKKKEIARAKSAIDDMLEDAKKFAPVYKKIQYPKIKDGLLYEVDMFDIHFGRLTWEDESGANFDVKIAKRAIESSLLKLLALAQGQPIEKILLPLGNDFFNVDSKFNTTTNGTPQQEDTRWQKTYRMGREICVWMIDTCSQIAPVDVVIVPGNHDMQRSFYLGDSLECWYHNSKDVTINNGASTQKYYTFGKNLIGFTHGSDLKLEKLPLIMALDVPDLWANAKYREWHTGDKHHKKDLLPLADEQSGMLIRILRSLTAFDAWTFNSGYRSLRSSEAFLWHPETGLTAQYTALPNLEEEE